MTPDNWQRMVSKGEATAANVAQPSELVLICGGTESQRVAARSENGRLMIGSEPLAVGDLQSLLRCAPHSRAVIICGDVAGMSPDVVERLVRARAPQATLVRADRFAEQTGSARRRGRRAMQNRLRGAAAAPH
jgi:hypothetical protein